MFEVDEGMAVSERSGVEVDGFVCAVVGVSGRVRCCLDGMVALSVGDACPYDAMPGHELG